MIFIVYADSNASSMSSTIGLADYSYYFVMKQFKSLLERIGPVVVVNNVNPDVDFIYQEARRLGEDCIFFSFTPPHKTVSDLDCPTIPVFAWEYSTIPDEAWAGDEKSNWADELLKYGQAITHSEHTCSAVRNGVIQEGYPVISIPAPLWDKFQRYYDKKAVPLLQTPEKLTVDGWVVDSADFETTRNKECKDPSITSIFLSGVIYTSVFNPNDGRKNWQDLLNAFCWAFKDEKDATLVLKLTHADPAFCYEVVADELPKLMPFFCRVVLVQGYLSDLDYSLLISKTSYIVNSAYGEGQCLPLMEFMSAGKPAVAPDHTGMADYINQANSFVVESSDEWYHWPHDPRLLLKTFRKKINWESLVDCYKKSFHEAKIFPDRYRARSGQATNDLNVHCSHDTAEKRIREVLSVNQGFNVASYNSRRQKIMRPIYRHIWAISGALGLQSYIGEKISAILIKLSKMNKP